MTRSKAVAATEPAPVPDLRYEPQFEITSEDIALPRVYIGQYSGEAVKERRVEAGSIYAADGPEDPMPTILAAPGDKPGVLFYVLHMRKGKSYSAPGEPLQLWDFNDETAHKDAWVTYNYTVFVPDYDNDVPCKLLLTKTGRPSALSMNRIIKKNEGVMACWQHGFRLTAKERPHPSGKYFAATVSYLAEDQTLSEYMDRAGELAVSMTTSQAADFKATGEEPAI